MRSIESIDVRGITSHTQLQTQRHAGERKLRQRLALGRAGQERQRESEAEAVSAHAAALGLLPEMSSKTFFTVAVFATSCTGQERLQSRLSERARPGRVVLPEAFSPQATRVGPASQTACAGTGLGAFI